MHRITVDNTSPKLHLGLPTPLQKHHLNFSLLPLLRQEIQAVVPPPWPQKPWKSLDNPVLYWGMLVIPLSKVWGRREKATQKLALRMIKLVQKNIEVERSILPHQGLLSSFWNNVRALPHDLTSSCPLGCHFGPEIAGTGMLLTWEP